MFAIRKHDTPLPQPNTEEPFTSSTRPSKQSVGICGLVVLGRGWPLWTACCPASLLGRFLGGMRILTCDFVRRSRCSWLHIIFLLKSCLRPMAVDVAVRRRTENWISKLGHPESVSTQLVPTIVGDIQHGGDVHRAILFMSLKWHTVIWEW